MLCVCVCARAYDIFSVYVCVCVRARDHRRRWGSDGWTHSLPGKREGRKFANWKTWCFLCKKKKRCVLVCVGVCFKLVFVCVCVCVCVSVIFLRYQKYDDADI